MQVWNIQPCLYVCMHEFIIKMLILKSGTQHWEDHISVKYWSILKIHDIFVIRILWASQKWPKVLSNVLWSPRNCKKKQSVQSISGHPVCMYASMQICMYASMQVWKCATLQVCMYACLHGCIICKDVSMQVYLYSSMQVWKYTSMWVYKYPNINICKFASIQGIKYNFMQYCKYVCMQVGKY